MDWNYFLKILTAWLHTHPNSAIIICFFVAFFESLAIIGTIIPGSITLSALGLLIGAGIIPPAASLIAAMLGAFVGDVLTFWLGYHFQNHLREIWPFKKYPNLLAKGEYFFYKHGGKSVFIGRFVGPMRSVLPMVAGMLNMPPWRFLLVSIFSAALWAPAYMLPGIILGATASDLPPERAGQLLLGLLGGLIVLWALYYIIRIIVIWLLGVHHHLLVSLWLYLSKKKYAQGFVRLLASPTTPQDADNFKLFTLALFCVLALGLLVFAVHYQNFITTTNHVVFYLLQSWRTSFFRNIFIAITFVGQTPVMLFLVAIVAIYLFIRRYYFEVGVWIANCLIVVGLTYFGKILIKMPRPLGSMMMAHSTSFPSGHTALATAIYGLLAAIIIMNKPFYYWRRRWVMIATALLVSLIAFSRLYLGAHWLTDVIAAMLLGIFCFSLSTILLRRQPHAKVIEAKPLLMVSFLAVVVGWSGLMFSQFHRAQFLYSLYWPHYPLTSQQWWQQGSQLLPRYHHNRRGQIDMPFNLQWVGKLEIIEQQLKNRGWHVIPKSTVLQFAQTILTEDRLTQAPLIPSIYRNNPPVLTMIYSFPAPSSNPPLILQLWPSGYYLTDRTLPLWLGNIHYRVTWHYHGLRSHIISPTLTSPWPILQEFLSSPQWEINNVFITENNEKDILFMIRPKGNSI